MRKENSHVLCQTPEMLSFLHFKRPRYSVPHKYVYIYMVTRLEVTQSNYAAVAPDVQLLFSIILNLFTISYIYLDTSRATVEKLDIKIQENNWSSRMQLFLC